MKKSPASSDSVTLHQLRAFDGAARLGSQTLAANEFGVRPATVAAQVAALESALGLELFEQTEGGLRLTEVGRALWPHARDVMSASEVAAVAMDEMAGRGVRGLRVVADSTVGVYIVPKLLGALRLEHLDLHCAVEILNRSAAGARLLSGEADVAIMGQLPQGEELVVRDFVDNHIVVIAAPEHPLAGASRVPLSRLADEHFVVREPGSGTRAALEALFSSHGLHVRIGLELGHNGAIKQSVAAGLGVAAMSTVAVTRETRAGRLVVLDVDSFPIERRWHLVYVASRRLPSSAPLFCQFAEAWASQLSNDAL